MPSRAARPTWGCRDAHSGSVLATAGRERRGSTMAEEGIVLDPEGDATTVADPSEAGATDPKGDQWWEDDDG